MKEIWEEIVVCGKNLFSRRRGDTSSSQASTSIWLIVPSNVNSSSHATFATWEELLPMAMQVDGKISFHYKNGGVDTNFCLLEGQEE